MIQPNSSGRGPVRKDSLSIPIRRVHGRYAQLFFAFFLNRKKDLERLPRSYMQVAVEQKSAGGL
jgi:hypothetical protein